jgi:hypothetical protein
MIYEKTKESLCLGNAEKFQIWGAIFTNTILKCQVFMSFQVMFGFYRYSFLSFIGILDKICKVMMK